MSSGASRSRTAPKVPKLDVDEEEKLDFEVGDELQLKAQKDEDIDDDPEETPKVGVDDSLIVFALPE